MTKADLPSGMKKTIVGKDELQRLTVTRFPPGPESAAFFSSLNPSDYWNNLLAVVVDARQVLTQSMGVMPDLPPDPSIFVAFTDGWYAATCWGYADAIMLREDAALEQKLAWSQMLGAMMTEWDWRLRYKSHIVRGVTTQKAASAGGKQRNRVNAPKTAKLLTFIYKLLPEHSLKYAAEQAYGAGLGPSVGAILKTWDRKKRLLKGL
jgi:hypothetical protein